jgi:hypothetical protein
MIDDDELPALKELATKARGKNTDRPFPLDPETVDLGQVYSEDGYCQACGNGYWKWHMPDCQIADLAEAVLQFIEEREE